MNFVYNKPKVKFMQTSTPTEHYRKWLLCVTGTKQDSTSAQRLFNWNVSINGYKQGSVGFPQQKKKTSARVTWKLLSQYQYISYVVSVKFQYNTVPKYRSF